MAKFEIKILFLISEEELVYESERLLSSPSC